MPCQLSWHGAYWRTKCKHINQVASGLKFLVEKKLVQPGGYNLDWGGGKYDSGTQYLKSHNIENVVYDPYNRSPVHNHKEILDNLPISESQVFRDGKLLLIKKYLDT